MKKLLLALTLPLTAMAVLSSCKPNETDPKKEVKLVVAPLTISVEASEEVVTKAITVEATDAWEITSTPDWIEAKDVTETGFSIDIEPYLDGEQETREGKVVVEMGDKKEEIVITQALFVPEIEPSLVVAPLSFEIIGRNEVLTREVTVEATAAWDVTEKPDWITVKDKTETGFFIDIAPYIDGENESRPGTIVVEMGDLSEDIEVTQLRYLNPVSLTLTPDEIPDAEFEQTYDIEVEASHAWEADTEAAWITISNVTEDGFTISVADYGDLADPSRTGTVVVTLQDPIGETTKEVTVIQNKPLVIIPLADYLGSYKVQGDMAWIDTYMTGGWQGFRAYESTETVTDKGSNVLSMGILGIDANMMQGYPINFAYDPETGSLKNKTQVVGYHADMAGLVEAPRTFTTIPDGEITLRLEDGEIVFPTTHTIDGVDYPLYIYHQYAAGENFASSIGLTNIKMIKQ